MSLTRRDILALNVLEDNAIDPYARQSLQSQSLVLVMDERSSEIPCR
jgi:hypothetical protein